MVFNDAGVMVPGVMMITWPDPFYHTSEDIADKCDPTQLKRAVFLTAASAYAIASAGNKEAIAIAIEVASNAIRRLGIAQSSGADMISHAKKEDIVSVARRVTGNVKGAALGEIMILNSVRTLAPADNTLNTTISQITANLNRIATEQIAILQQQAKATAALHGAPTPRFELSAEENSASKIIPSLLSSPKSIGYGAYQIINGRIPAETRAKIDMRSISDVHEALKLVNGDNSLLDIKLLLDSQYSRETDINALKSYFEALKGIGILEF
jgi:aminopeptidase YwaD